MKRITIAASIMTAVLGAFVTAGTVYGLEQDWSEIRAALGFQGWFTTATAKWQISFPYITQSANRGIAARTPGKIESELDFDRIDSPMRIITGTAAFGPHISVEGLLGAGSIGSGSGTDTDRFLPDAGGGLEFSQSKNEIHGDVKLGEVTLYYNNHRLSQGGSGPWGALVGYVRYQDQLHMTHAVQTVSVTFDGTSFPPVGPFPPGLVLNSYYNFFWEALRVGVLFQPSLTEKLSLTAELAGYPFVRYSGDGFWNLRAGNGQDNFRSTPPNFEQSSSTGYGWDVDLGLIYAVLDNLDLSAGYRYLHLYAANGTDTTFFANGPPLDSNLDWATVTRQGAYAAVLFKF